MFYQEKKVLEEQRKQLDTYSKAIALQLERVKWEK